MRRDDGELFTIGPTLHPLGGRSEPGMIGQTCLTRSHKCRANCRRTDVRRACSTRALCGSIFDCVTRNISDPNLIDECKSVEGDINRSSEASATILPGANWDRNYEFCSEPPPRQSEPRRVHDNLASPYRGCPSLPPRSTTLYPSGQPTRRSGWFVSAVACRR